MLQFFLHGFRSVFHGSRAYWIWVTTLLILALLGLNAYARQLAHGLITSGTPPTLKIAPGPKDYYPEPLDPRQSDLIVGDFFILDIFIQLGQMAVTPSLSWDYTKIEENWH